MIENYITCFCHKEAKKCFFKKEGITKGQMFYICGNSQTCNFFLKENQHYLTYKDIIDEDCSVIFDIEWNKKYPLSNHMLQYEYLIPYMYGVEINQKNHPTKHIKRRSPFCFIFSNVEYSSFFIDRFENNWKTPSPLYGISGVDVITDDNEFCRIVPSLVSWSRKTDENIFSSSSHTNKNNRKEKISLSEKKKIGRSYHKSQKKYTNRIEWEKHWIDLHGTEEMKNGWLWNPRIKYVIFEEREGFFMVKKNDIIEMIKQLNINQNTSLLWYKYNCVYDPRKAYKIPFINPCSFGRYDYKLWFRKDDFNNIIKEWKYNDNELNPVINNNQPNMQDQINSKNNNIEYDEIKIEF